MTVNDISNDSKNEERKTNKTNLYLRITAQKKQRFVIEKKSSAFLRIDLLEFLKNSLTRKIDLQIVQ